MTEEQKFELNERQITNYLSGHEPDYLRRNFEKFWSEIFLQQKNFDNIEIIFKLK